MELPLQLKDLYRHWELHTGTSIEPDSGVSKEIGWFINERMRIWEQKTSGKAPPYTRDAILSTYRFCNIFRELDRQTIEIHTLLNPLRDDFPLWLLNMFYARMVARPETLRFAGLLSSDEKENQEVYERLINSPRPRFGTPYVFPISTIMRSKTPTRELFIANYLPSVMKKTALEITSWQKESVYDGVERILPLFGFNLRFLWTEVLIDVAYQFPVHIDLFARFPIGPGSLPIIRMLSKGEDTSLFVQKLAAQGATTILCYKRKPIRLSSENWEGIGCEFRKYTNLKNGHGRRRLYPINSNGSQATS